MAFLASIWGARADWKDKGNLLIGLESGAVLTQSEGNPLAYERAFDKHLPVYSYAAPTRSAVGYSKAHMRLPAPFAHPT